MCRVSERYISIKNAIKFGPSKLKYIKKGGIFLKKEV